MICVITEFLLCDDVRVYNVIARDVLSSSLSVGMSVRFNLDFSHFRLGSPRSRPRASVWHWARCIPRFYILSLDSKYHMVINIVNDAMIIIHWFLNEDFFL